jgi:cation diffusion facilitator family transporter
MNEAREASWGRRQRAALISLVVGTALCGAKFVAWFMTDSAAVLSDALESIVNVFAAGFALFATRWGAQPADRDHPYGHGKIEQVAAAFEGGLVVFAALLVFWSAVDAAAHHGVPQRLDAALAISAVAAFANLVLGLWLLRVGRRESSATLVADGKHVLSDVWVTAGVLAGLGLVRLTGRAWFDPLAAGAVGLLLVYTGWHLLREAADTLLDREQPALLAKIVEGFNRSTVRGVSRLHRLHAIGTGGSEVHVDAHVFVPAHWSIGRAHEAAEEVERQIKKFAGIHGEMLLHLDPHEGLDEHLAPIDGPPVLVEHAVSAGRREAHSGVAERHEERDHADHGEHEAERDRA